VQALDSMPYCGSRGRGKKSARAYPRVGLGRCGCRAIPTWKLPVGAGPSETIWTGRCGC